ncbi:MAG: hypothetical protein Q9191_007643 [Dirinaria sp. TL-2023a]
MHYLSIITFFVFSLLKLPTILALTLPLTSNNPASLLTLNNHTNTHIPLYLPEAVCVRITDPPMIGLNPSNCETAALATCVRLARRFDHHHVITGRWIWTDELEGCAIGYYLPQGAIAPSVEICEDVVLKGIIDKCATDSRFNAGSRNVRRLPSFADDGTAVVETELRYLMAPERLTL